MPRPTRPELHIQRLLRYACTNSILKQGQPHVIDSSSRGQHDGVPLAMFLEYAKFAETHLSELQKLVNEHRTEYVTCRVLLSPAAAAPP